MVITQQTELAKRTRYNSIEGLRAYSALGIVLMHVLSNGKYHLKGFVFEQLIPSFTDLVFLFMVISGFSMCCGYYEKIVHNEISISDFYSKRYKKVWPYFAVLCILDIAISPSINSLYEMFANLTLCFGLLPNPDISVIGVGWFLGLVFVFYLIFPFYCYLLSSKRMAWFSFVIALIFNYLCVIRFDAGRTNIVYSSVYFLLGGLVYLYKETLERFANKYRIVVLVGILVGTIAYYIMCATTISMLFLFGCMLVYALNTRKVKCLMLNNSVVRCISNISLEIYLSHMVVFRVLEKLKCLHLVESNIMSYIITVTLTFIGTIVFSIILKKALGWVSSKCTKH